jgi:phosphatidylglycerol lysyltransferase
MHWWRGYGSGEWLALGALLLLSGILWYLYRQLLQKGRFYQWVLGNFPSVELLIEDVRGNKVQTGQFLLTVLISVIIEFTGIIHVFIAMKALQLDPALFAALMAYIVSVIFLQYLLLRGLGAIEVSRALSGAVWFLKR